MRHRQVQHGESRPQEVPLTGARTGRNLATIVLLRGPEMLADDGLFGGVGIAAAADYAIAVEGCDIKLSELAVGIGPFVVGPAVERKIGVAAFSALSIDATMWRNSDWAKKKGLFAEVHENVVNMDESVKRLANILAHSNPEAMAEMKKIFWKGTEHWDTLLHERALISGKLILSSFSKEAIGKFKAK